MDEYADSGERYCGGSAFNVSVQGRRAGAQVSLLSAIGTDADGDQFLGTLEALQINTERLQRCAGSTSRVTIRLDANKAPRFEAAERGVMGTFELTEDDQIFLRTHHAARGILRHGLEQPFEQFCALDLPDTLKMADFVGGTRHSLPVEAIDEYAPSLDIVIRSMEKTEELEALERISRDHGCIALATMGSGGSVAFADGAKYVQEASRTAVVDTTGAGDAYSAYFIVTYLSTRDIQESMRRATQAAAQTVRSRGAI